MQRLFYVDLEWRPIGVGHRKLLHPYLRLIVPDSIVWSFMPPLLMAVLTPDGLSLISCLYTCRTLLLNSSLLRLGSALHLLLCEMRYMLCVPQTLNSLVLLGQGHELVIILLWIASSASQMYSTESGILSVAVSRGELLAMCCVGSF